MPARRPVTRSLLPLTVVPIWRAVPAEVVAAGSPRSHAPEVAVSVPLAFVVQPRLVSNVSLKTTLLAAPTVSVNVAVLSTLAPSPVTVTV